jgi:hypothetical protein
MPEQTSTGAQMGASDWWNWAQLAYGIYKDRNPSKPQFEPTPLSEEQKELYRIYMMSLMNPATVNNASQLQQMATQMLGGLSNMRWQSAPTFNGAPGYSGSSSAFTPPQHTPGPGFGQPPANPDARGSGRTPFDKDPNGGDGGSGYPFGGGPFNSDYAPGGVGTGDPRGGQSFTDFWSSITKAAGPWNKNQETYEKWISRGVSLLASSFGLPIPANLIDKGIDAAQWLFGKVSGGGQSGNPLEDFYNNPNGGKYGSAYGSGQRPPGFGGTTPAPYGMTGGQNTGFGGFGAPGSVPRPSNTDGFAGGATTPYRDASGNTRYQYTPSFGDSRASYYNSQFWGGLQGPGMAAGPGSYGGMSPVHVTSPRAGTGPMGGQGRR